MASPRGMAPLAHDQKPVSRPAIREANFGDYQQIAALQVRNGLTATPRPAWTATWSENPVYRRLQGTWPIGWVLETGTGDIVGFIASIPVAYRFRGRELRAAATGSWVTDPAYRGYSIMVLNAVMKQPDVDLFITNTASARSDATLRMLRWSRVPAGVWDKSHFWVTNCHGFSRWVLGGKRVPLPGVMAVPLALALYLRNTWVERRLRNVPPPGAVDFSSAFDGRFDEFWEKLEARNQGVLLGVRSRETLQWHFNSSLEGGTARILTLDRASGMTAYAVFDRRDSLGLKRVRLIDFQALENAGPALASFISRMLQEARETGVQVLESTGCPLQPLGSPDRVAPYRRTLDAWRYYYKATSDPLRQALAAPDAWAPSYYDGDASL